VHFLIHSVRLTKTPDFLLCPKNVLDIEPRREFCAPCYIVFSATEYLPSMVTFPGCIRLPSDDCRYSARHRPWPYLLPSSAGMPLDIPQKVRPQLTPSFQYAAVKTYDYHPVMPLPTDDPEAPDQSLGDCAICMDAIHVDPSLRRRPTSLDDKSDWEKTTSKRKTRGGTAGGILNAVQMGVGSATARKNYSLAPCHHLFVSFQHLLQLSFTFFDSTRTVWKRYLFLRVRR